MEKWNPQTEFPWNVDPVDPERDTNEVFQTLDEEKAKKLWEEINQLKSPTAEQLKEQGIQQAVDHAEKEHEGWSDECLEFFKRWLSQFPTGHEFLMENFNSWALDNGLTTPPSLQAFGHLPKKAAKAKLIYATDQVAKGKTQRSHAGLCRIWKKL